MIIILISQRRKMELNQDHAQDLPAGEDEAWIRFHICLYKKKIFFHIFLFLPLLVPTSFCTFIFPVAPSIPLLVHPPFKQLNACWFTLPGTVLKDRNINVNKTEPLLLVTFQSPREPFLWHTPSFKMLQNVLIVSGLPCCFSFSLFSAPLMFRCLLQGSTYPSWFRSRLPKLGQVKSLYALCMCRKNPGF